MYTDALGAKGEGRHRSNMVTELGSPLAFKNQKDSKKSRREKFQRARVHSQIQLPRQMYCCYGWHCTQGIEKKAEP